MLEPSSPSYDRLIIPYPLTTQTANRHLIGILNNVYVLHMHQAVLCTRRYPAHPVLALTLHPSDK